MPCSRCQNPTARRASAAARVLPNSLLLFHSLACEHNELVELHAQDLCFSLEETHAFLERTTTFQFSASTIEHVAGRTEGRVAGLHLLAFALLRQELEQPAERFLTTLTDEHRHLLAYFVT